MQRERPIIFTADSVNKIRAGTKTQTRRVVKWKLREPGLNLSFSGLDVGHYCTGAPEHGWVLRSRGAGGCWNDRTYPALCPFGQVGDVLWAITIKPIPGFEHAYGAGDDGHVYRTDLAEPRVMRPQLTSSGYQRVTLCKHGGRCRITVHEAVCRAFYGAPSIITLGTSNPEVRHLDGDRSNNLPENLDWGTPQQNWQDRKSMGRGIHQEHHNAKLSLEIADAMRLSGNTAWALSKEYGVNHKTVRNILNGKTWVRHDPAPANMPRWASRLTLEITEVRVERLMDTTGKDVAAEGFPFSSDLDQFKLAWNAINKAHPWESSPFVWVIAFKVIQ